MKNKRTRDVKRSLENPLVKHVNDQIGKYVEFMSDGYLVSGNIISGKVTTPFLTFNVKLSNKFADSFDNSVVQVNQNDILNRRI